MSYLESALEPHESEKFKSPYEWFINQPHIPFDQSSDAHGTFYTLYQKFLQELSELHLKTGSEHFWFTKEGKLIGDEGSNVISSNSIKINKQKLRHIKLEQLGI